MRLSMHSTLVLPATRTLQNLATILGKALAHCHEKGIDQQVFLQARIERTIVFLNSFEASQIDGSEGSDILIPLRDRDVYLKGETYLTAWVLPNFYFHVTTVYGLLRHGGVNLGKRDYIGI